MLKNSGIKQYEADWYRQLLVYAIFIDTGSCFSGAILSVACTFMHYRMAAGGATITSKLKARKQEGRGQKGSLYKLRQLLFSSLETSTIPLTLPPKR